MVLHRYYKGNGMGLEILGKTKDLRTDTYVLYAQIPIPDYLSLVGDEFDTFEIQRTRQRYRAYERMRRDIVNGALLPTITLAVLPEHASEFVPLIESEAYDKIVEMLQEAEQIRILDGLQRTYSLSELAESHNFEPDHTVHVEIWFETNLDNLIYRIIVLNAGQKPMSLRHQIELLFGAIKAGQVRKFL